MTIGTRLRNNQVQTHQSERSNTRSLNTDPGASKRVVATDISFGAGVINAVTAAELSAFAANDVILVQGTNLNNGEFTVRHAVTIGGDMTVDPAPKTEAAGASVTIVAV